MEKAFLQDFFSNSEANASELLKKNLGRNVSESWTDELSEYSLCKGLDVAVHFLTNILSSFQSKLYVVVAKK